MNNNTIIAQPLTGLGYLFKGVQLLRHPQLRVFVLVPLLINVLIFASAFWFLFTSITDWIETYMQELPTFLSWLSYVLWPIIIFSILFSFSFIFSTIANLIAAPFNGLLAEKTEILLTKSAINDDGWQDLLKDLPRILKRECQKWVYFLPRMLGCFILFFIPVIGQTIAPIVWLVFAGWMMAIQYADYPFDNHKVPFAVMRKTLGERFGKNITFGMIISFCTTIPLLNFIIMPIAVCGATAAWVDIYKHQVLSNPLNRIE
ncbi:sulfate transporter CysZ [Psychromonas sp. 14N.309.X.WAT.B.A12]|uniref:sulfate transporter CysZ n=1 Tax=Psychromonas sp. 14N.309.X.WAT.B.A12 TaxID=2998322 RepID=UPI0025B27141|nr:sulfate transporter CysZ [Psychromonas sp. 14N.309.X.WAT.B.A12]MDN2663072.1 sulfate transporter CysZ [Psychromonas sp. 14N.309.X.WAT.B.A12]